jgi:hypothetical protein
MPEVLAVSPGLKNILEEKDYFLSRQPVLCGIIKYDLYLRYHAAGLRHEHQSLAIWSLAHIYVAARLKHNQYNGRAGQPRMTADAVARMRENNTKNRVWPDMEYAIYAQDPNWLFVGGLPRTHEEAQRKFLLACGSPATNSARNIDPRKLSINHKKVRDFWEIGMFGEGVYFEGVEDDEGDKTDGPFDELAEKKMTKRLFEVMDGSDTQSCARIARLYMSARRPSTETTTSPGKTRPLDGAAILSNFANWLDADMAALYFDWYELVLTCEGMWCAINSFFRGCPDGDPTR